MTVGGTVAGLAVALLAGIISRMTPLREDASFKGAGAEASIYPEAIRPPHFSAEQDIML